MASFADIFRRRRRVQRWRALLAIALLVAAPGAAQAVGPIIVGFAIKGFGLFAGQSKLTDYLANRTFTNAPREGSCDVRRQRILGLLPDTLRYAGFAQDIYTQAADLKSAGLTWKDLGNGRQAFYDPAGQRYAELRTDAVSNEVAVVFRGTRLTVRGDIATDALSFAGLVPAYYKWASDLVGRIARDNPGKRIVVTGHSLGGGLTLYAVLTNPGVTGVAFDAPGLSWLTWRTTSRSERARTNAALTVIATRNASHIDPITALSLAHRTVLPGHVLIVDVATPGRLGLHSTATLMAGLQRLAATKADGTACDGVLGPLVK